MILLLNYYKRMKRIQCQIVKQLQNLLNLLLKGNNNGFNDSNESLNTENFIIVKSKSHLVIYSKKLQKLYKLIWWRERSTCEKKWLIFDKDNDIIENINITNLELDETSKIKGNFVLEET